MACGDKYLGLLVTASGFTPDNPSGVQWYSVPTVWVYEEWWARANQLGVRANEHWDRLVSIETKLGQTDQREAVQPAYDAMVEKVNALQAPLAAMFRPDVLTWTAPIDNAIEAGRDAICVLELVDDAIEKLGKKPPAIPTAPRPAKPTPTPSVGDWIVTLTILGGLGYLGYSMAQQEE